MFLLEDLSELVFQIYSMCSYCSLLRQSRALVTVQILFLFLVSIACYSLNKSDSFFYMLRCLYRKTRCHFEADPVSMLEQASTALCSDYLISSISYASEDYLWHYAILMLSSYMGYLYSYPSHLLSVKNRAMDDPKFLRRMADVLDLSPTSAQLG